MVAEPLNPKYQAIMLKAKELLWKYGLRKVTVGDVCRESGVSKMTFYRFFPNKVELAKAVFDAAVMEGEKKYQAIMKDNIPVSEMIVKMINLKMEGTGDISREFLLDLYKNPEYGLKEHVEKKSAASWEQVIRYFRIGQRKGIFRKDIRMEFLLYFTRKMGEMITDEGLISLYGSPQELIRELTGFFVYGVTDRHLNP